MPQPAPGSKIGTPQYDSAAAGRRRAAPLAENFRHHFARNHARQFPITIGVGVAQSRRVDRVQQLQIMIAHIFEIPARAGIARNRSFPGRMRGRDSAGSRERDLLHQFGLGDVRERETLRREANLRAPDIFERPKISAHAEIVGDAAARAEWLIPAAGSRGDVGNTGTASCRNTRKLFAEERTTAESLDPSPACPPAVRFPNSRKGRPCWDAAPAATTRFPPRRARCRERRGPRTDSPCLRTSCLARPATQVHRRGDENLRIHRSSFRPSESG